jgi:hypothetical protein
MDTDRHDETLPRRASPGDAEGTDERGPIAERLEESTEPDPASPTADTTPIAMVDVDPRAVDEESAAAFDERGADPQAAATRRAYEAQGGPPVV